MFSSDSNFRSSDLNLRPFFTAKSPSKLPLGSPCHSKITGPIRQPQPISSRRHKRSDGRISYSYPLASMRGMGLALNHGQIALQPPGPVEWTFILHSSILSRNISRRLRGPLDPKPGGNFNLRIARTSRAPRLSTLPRWQQPGPPCIKEKGSRQSAPPQCARAV